jgi:hypothetical protein
VDNLCHLDPLLYIYSASSSSMILMDCASWGIWQRRSAGWIMALLLHWSQGCNYYTISPFATIHSRFPLLSLSTASFLCHSGWVCYTFLSTIKIGHVPSNTTVGHLYFKHILPHFYHVALSFLDNQGQLQLPRWWLLPLGP